MAQKGAQQPRAGVRQNVVTGLDGRSFEAMVPPMMPAARMDAQTAATSRMTRRVLMFGRYNTPLAEGIPGP